jgi:hypothetical protein
MNTNLAGLMAPESALVKPISPTQIRPQKVAADLEVHANAMSYPALIVYSEKIVNSLKEKFRSFSGAIQMAVEVRHSQDRLDGLQESLELYVDSITQVLDSNRGDWGNGMYYCGGYEVTLGAVKHGGRNFIQAAKITFEIGVSRS